MFLNLCTFFCSEIVHEDFAAAEIVNSLEDVHLRATKKHGKQKGVYDITSKQSCVIGQDFQPDVWLFEH